MKTTNMRNVLMTGAAILAMSLPLGAQEVPAGAGERGYFLLPELHEMMPDQRTKMEANMQRVQPDIVKSDKTHDAPLKIAMMFLSLETSDAGTRMNISTRARLEEMGIPVEVTEFMIRPDEHECQGVQIDQVLDGDFNYVVIGPPEYQVQTSNLSRLAKTIPTRVMNIVNPFVDTLGAGQQPITHVGFDHTIGAEALCRWIIKETGGRGPLPSCAISPV